jgi:hypothetical protein
MIWALVIVMAVVGGYWVKVRRARKARFSEYVPK